MLASFLQSLPRLGWRWTPLNFTNPNFICMFVFRPETSGQSEINQRDMKVAAVVFDALIKPVGITIKDPAVLFVRIYMAIIYGIYYSCASTPYKSYCRDWILNLTWLVFEAFPLVYPVYYGMNLGQVGLVFLCILVSCLTGVSILRRSIWTKQPKCVFELKFQFSTDYTN